MGGTGQPPAVVGLVAGVVGLVALAVGLYFGGHPSSLPGPLRDAFVDDTTAIQADAVDLIKDNYRRKVPDNRLETGSLRGMVEVLDDRFSHYFTPREYGLFQESIGGEFSGVGMTVVEHRRGLLVTGVFRGSPAKRARIREGDVIVAVDGDSIAGESSELATARIKGRPGTFVRLTLRRDGSTRRLRIKRERITVPVVDERLRTVDGKRLGVVAIASFTSGVHGQLRRGVRRLLRRGARGFVIDLRQNGGGLLSEAVLVSSVFVPNGVVVVTRGRKQPRRVLRAQGDAIARKPLTVLVDRGTASASEIVTAALHERLGAKVVGRRTFGKGVFGQIFDLSNGGALDLTLGNYFTPKGRNLGGKGIAPDVEAQDDAETPRDEALERALGLLAGEVRPSQKRG
jgi:carboxyl-terminal processing protease